MDIREMKEIDGIVFEKMAMAGAKELFDNIKEVNDLNVFPIPDGDTGDNMYKTLEGGISMMQTVIENSVCAKAKALSRGMLLNARGNSGVILSQLFKGLYEGLKDVEIASINDLTRALKMGVERAYKAVMEPVEGTILTVAREAAERVVEEVSAANNVSELCDVYIKEVEESLKRTPELLGVLKEAGVVDSGGAGLFYIAFGIKKYIHENTILSDELFSADIEVTKTFFKKKKVFKKFGTCVVSNGEGLNAILKDLGADVILEGGEGNNTSIKDFIDAFNEINAKDIYVLPNNSNIFMAVNQAASMITKYNIHLIKTKNIGEVYSAIAMLDYSSEDPEEIENNFKEAFANTVTCMYCKSIRDTNINSVEIKENDYIGFTNDKMISSHESLLETISDSLQKLDIKDYEIMTLIYGKNFKDEDKEVLNEEIMKLNKRIEVYAINGLQESYDLVIILE